MQSANSAACQFDSGQNVQVRFSKKDQVRVVGEFEYEGQVVVVPENRKNERSVTTKSLPLRVTAKLDYSQRVTGKSQAVRFYHQAEAKIRIDGGVTTPKLLPTNRLIIARIKERPKQRVEMASIGDTLNQKEFELIQTSADALSLPGLFSKQGVKVGDKWEPSLDALAKFLNVHNVLTSDVKMKFKQLQNGVARVYVAGGVKAEQNDVTTEIELSGYALIDIKKKRVKRVKLTASEQCPPGQIAPGFHGRTRIDQSFTYGVETQQLSNRSLASAMRSTKIQHRLKYESPGGDYRITYDPRWKLIAGEDDSAIMRFIDRGDLLTQCTVVKLPRRAPNQPLQLAKYKSEIEKIVSSDEHARIVKTNEVTTQSGLRAMTVMVAGEAEQLPVNWIYYHVSDRQGRQITFVFTLAESVADRVLGAAEQLTDEFRFLSSPGRLGEPKKKVAGKTGGLRTSR